MRKTKAQLQAECDALYEKTKELEKDVVKLNHENDELTRYKINADMMRRRIEGNRKHVEKLFEVLYGMCDVSYTKRIGAEHLVDRFVRRVFTDILYDEDIPF